MQGASGDQSTRYFRDGQTFEEAERIGSTIGAEAVRVIESMQYLSGMDINVEEEIIPLKLRKFPSKEQAQKAVSDRKAELAAKQASGAGYLDCWNAQLKLFGWTYWGILKCLKKQLPSCLPMRHLSNICSNSRCKLGYAARREFVNLHRYLKDLASFSLYQMVLHRLCLPEALAKAAENDIDAMKIRL